MERRRILATAWHAGGANAILPVIKQLRAERKIDVYTLAYDTALSILKTEESVSLTEKYGMPNFETAKKFSKK